MSEFQNSAELLTAFRREPDGRWSCLERTDLVTPDGPLSIEPGAVFVVGEPVGGVDVAEFLEQLGAQFGS